MTYFQFLASLAVIGWAALCSAVNEDDIVEGNGFGNIDDGVSFLQYSTKTSLVEEQNAAAPPEGVQPSELSISNVPKFVISTGQYGKRTLPLVQELQKYGRAFQNTCRVQAVVGSQCFGFWRGQLMVGPASVSTSHMKIWQHMLDKQIPVAMVMEDDALGLSAPNLISLLQTALDRYRNYDIFRVSQIPVPSHTMLKQEVNASIWHHEEKKCREFYGTQMYIMTLAGAKFALTNFQYGISPHALDVYDVYNHSAYTNLDAYRVECFSKGIMRFMTDEEGDWSFHDEWHVNSESAHPENITTMSTLSSTNKLLIQDVLPDCPAAGILMEPCANFKEGVWTVSKKLS